MEWYWHVAWIFVGISWTGALSNIAKAINNAFADDGEWVDDDDDDEDEDSPKISSFLTVVPGDRDA